MSGADDENRPRVVGLVSSAGGLHALSSVLARLPADFPAAIIALQHMEPERPSMLAEILGRRTPLRVEPARDGDPLRPGVVLVTPPARHTLVCPDGTVALIWSGQRPPSRPSADLLLTSMAISLGARAIAVVLSGSGNDGTAGAAAVKRLGGLVVAQDRATSQNFGMPGSAIGFDKIVHQVAPLERIGGLLVELVADARTTLHPGL